MKQYNTITMLNMLIENPHLRFENNDKTIFIKNGDIYIGYKDNEWLVQDYFSLTSENINALWTIEVYKA